MGFDTESEGESLPTLGIDDAGDLFTGTAALADAALGDWAGDEDDGASAAVPVIPAGDDAANAASFLDDSKAPESRVTEHRLLLAGLVFSLLLHFSLGGVLVTFEPDEHEPLIPQSVSIRLLPVNPLREERAEQEAPGDEAEPAAEPMLAESVAEEIELPAEEIIPEAVADNEPVPEAVVETAVAQSEEPMPEARDAQLPSVPAVIVIPDTTLVTRSIRSMESENNARLWAYDCNAQQEESDFIRCDDQSTPDYDRVRENNTYRSLNPVRVLSRSERTLPAVTENAAALAGRLQNMAIPEGLSDYLMEEVEAGITHNTNAGNRTLENIDVMTDKSDAAKIARDVLGDPWIKTQSSINAQRRRVPR